MRGGFGSTAYGRNGYGAFVCHYSEPQLQVWALTQLFLNHELWGIDRVLLDIRQDRSRQGFGCFGSTNIEIMFVETLKNYLTFANETLKVSLPLRFVAGATGVEGFKMTAPAGTRFIDLNDFKGRCVNDAIVYEGTITDYSADIQGILLPFFRRLWDECGLSRPDEKEIPSP